MTSFLNYDLDFKIIHSHIGYLLERDFVIIKKYEERNQSPMVFDVEYYFKNYSTSLIQRVYEQSKSFIKINSETPKDFSSLIAIIRTMYELLIDFDYLFSCPIFKAKFAIPFKEQLQFKFHMIEYYGLAFHLKNFNTSYSDIPRIFKDHNISYSDLVTQIKNKKKFFKNFQENHFNKLIEHDEYKGNHQNKLKRNFKSFINNINSLKRLAKCTHYHRLLSMETICSLKGYDETFSNFYSYLSDHCHLGKASIAEYGPRLYDKSDSISIKTLEKVCLFILCHVYVEYNDLNNKLFNVVPGINTTYTHEATGTKYDTIKTIDYWVNYYRKPEYRKSQFKKPLI
jgi:hypothetical protein